MSFVHSGIETDLEFYRQVLDLRAYRQQILTADIANASTPNFKAVDLDFAQALKAVAEGSDGQNAGPVWLIDDPQHLPLPGSGGIEGAAATAVKYQIGTPVTLDGNSVDLNQEKVAAGENAVQYEAAASFASQVIKMMMVAINGSGSQSSNGG